MPMFTVVVKNFVRSLLSASARIGLSQTKPLLFESNAGVAMRATRIGYEPLFLDMVSNCRPFGTAFHNSFDRLASCCNHLGVPFDVHLCDHGLRSTDTDTATGI